MGWRRAGGVELRVPLAAELDSPAFAEARPGIVTGAPGVAVPNRTRSMATMLCAVVETDAPAVLEAVCARRAPGSRREGEGQRGRPSHKPVRRVAVADSLGVK
jgi:hypothetical protein